MTKNANFSPRSTTKGCCTVGREDKSPHLCFSVSPPPSFLFFFLARSLAHSPLSDLLSGCSSMSVAGIESNSLLVWAAGHRPLPLGSHLHYEREDLLAGEYNADLSVSIHRDREPSSSRVPLRRGYTYPPSAARCRERRRWRRRRRKNVEGKNETGLRSILRLAG